MENRDSDEGFYQFSSSFLRLQRYQAIGAQHWQENGGMGISPYPSIHTLTLEGLCLLTLP
jgi:hypothetical protein